VTEFDASSGLRDHLRDFPTSLYRKLSYDAIADFAPVSLVTRVEYFMFVPNSSPAHSVKGFINQVRSRPGQLTMASPGTGSAPYLAEMLFLQLADMKMTHVPYRGAAPAFSDLIPGRVDCYFGSGTLLSYSRSGQVLVLASTGPTRNAAAPDVPAIAEYIPGYEVVSSQALFVPAKTPREIDVSAWHGLGLRLRARCAWTDRRIALRAGTRPLSAGASLEAARHGRYPFLNSS
jgi:tripartite-type tricarboxylate transporter receptor subunit TctC